MLRGWEEEEGPAKERNKELPEKWEKNHKQMVSWKSEGPALWKRDGQQS